MAGRTPASFSSAQEVLSKNPVIPSRTLRAGGPQSAPSGCPSLWLLSLTPGILPSALRASFAVRLRSRRGRGHARESDSGPEGTESSLQSSNLRQSQRRWAPASAGATGELGWVGWRVQPLPLNPLSEGRRKKTAKVQIPAADIVPRVRENVRNSTIANQESHA